MPRVWPPDPRPSDAIEGLAQAHADRGLALDELTLMPPHWDAEPTDHDWVISVLADATFRRPSIGAETSPRERGFDSSGERVMGG